MTWEGEVPSFCEQDSCEIVHVPFSGKTNHGHCRSFVNNLQPLLQKENFDLITGFNRMPGLDLYYSADVCYIADIRRRRSFFHKLTPRYRLFSAFEKAIFSPHTHTHILALSEIQRQSYIQEYGTQPDRFHPVPAGIDKEKIRSCISPDKRSAYRESFGVRENESMLLMVGSDFTRKGVKRAIKAVASLWEETKSVTKLFVIGKGNIRKMQSLAKSMEVAEHIIFQGGVNNVPEYLSAADILLHPAISENTGNAIVEAIIAGIPVLTTSNCGYAFHVEKSGAGKVINGFDFSQNEMNKKLQEIISLPEKTITAWKEKAIKYADKTDFYSRPTVIADIIEERVPQLMNKPAISESIFDEHVFPKS